MDIADYESFQENDDGTFDGSWDPTTTWAQAPFEVFRCCLLRTLMSYNGRSVADGGAELQPDLADGHPEISADGLTWTFHIKEGLKYAPPMQDVPITSLLTSCARWSELSSPAPAKNPTASSRSVLTRRTSPT